MESEGSACNFLAPVVIEATTPYTRLSVRIKRAIAPFYGAVFPRKAELKTTSSTDPSLPKDYPPLDLKPGEWVEVRSLKEINATLDENRKYKGLLFMVEMEKFCGQKFKVFKIVRIIKLESTGEVRKLRTPSIFLEGVYCNGENHQGCDRACFHFWKEAWMKRVPE